MNFKYGSFPFTAEAKLLNDARALLLTKDFMYIDPHGGVWIAPTGSIVNGASIPQVFWSITGGPLTGTYRSASIVHDVACEDKKRPWREVHLMFYYACRCGGTPILDAKILYAAVYHFGPRWGYGAYEATPDLEPELVANFVRNSNPSLSSIRKL